MSADVERSFSQYKHLLTDRRENLTELHTNKCSCLNITAMWRAVSSKPMEGKFFMNVLLLFLSFWRKNNIAENSRGKTRIFEFIKQKISVFTLIPLP